MVTHEEILLCLKNASESADNNENSFEGIFTSLDSMSMMKFIVDLEELYSCRVSISRLSSVKNIDNLISILVKN